MLILNDRDLCPVATDKKTRCVRKYKKNHISKGKFWMGIFLIIGAKQGKVLTMREKTDDVSPEGGAS